MEMKYVVMYDFYDNDGSTQSGLTIEFDTEEQAKEWIREGINDPHTGNFCMWRLVNKNNRKGEI